MAAAGGGGGASSAQRRLSCHGVDKAGYDRRLKGETPQRGIAPSGTLAGDADSRDQAWLRAHSARGLLTTSSSAGRASPGSPWPASWPPPDARVLVIDRYEIGERQTSACAAPTEWLRALGLADSMRQTFSDLVIHTPHTTARMRLPWTFSTFDYHRALRAAVGAVRRELRDRQGRRPHRHHRPHRPRRPDSRRCRRRARLAADARRRRRLPAARTRRCRAGSRCTPGAPATSSRSGSTAATCPPGYGWSFPAARGGPGRRRLVRPAPSRQGADGPPGRGPRPRRRCATRATGSRTSSARRRPTAIFFAGDSAGHCLPLTAEGIRTALYFGIACGRELRAVVDGRKSREAALRDYASFSPRTAGSSRPCCGCSGWYPRCRRGCSRGC